MWALIMVFAVGGLTSNVPSTGVASQIVYFTDLNHCSAALDQMKEAMHSLPTVTFLFHCQEVGK